MILACTSCDSRYDVTGHPIGQQFRCRCGTVITLAAPSPQAGMLACPHCGGAVGTDARACAYCATELMLKACPRCTSRVFSAYAHCPCCGVELTEAAASAVRADQPCPRCDRALAGRLVGDVLIDECATCQGVFLDHVAIKRVVMDRQQARADSLLGGLSRVVVHAVPPSAKMYVKCPCCHVVMNRRQFALGSGIIIDVCRQHGVFFDAGELPATVEFVMQGGLEKAQALEIERKRETMRNDLLNARFEAARHASSTSELGHHTATHSFGGGGGGSALGDILASLWS